MSDVGDGPVDPPDTTPATLMSTNNQHPCALLVTGELKCWGSNDFGELGQGDTEFRGDEPGEMGDNLAPVDLGTSMEVAQVSVATQHVCVRFVDGRVKCWGGNSVGKLGLGDTENRGDDPGEMGTALPHVELPQPAVMISAGRDHNCAILEDRSVRCWGLNDAGPLGVGHEETVGDEPGEMGDALPAVDLGTGATASWISAGHRHTCAVLDDGRMKCWGWNDYGQLGLGDTSDRGGSPGDMGDALEYVDLGTGVTVTAVKAGSQNTCAILDDGGLKCWGRNDWGALGIGRYETIGNEPGEMGDELLPINVGSGRTVLDVAEPETHVCARLDDHSVKCWGGNMEGELGLGDVEGRGDNPQEMGDKLPAVDLGTGRTALSVDSSWKHSCALLDDGTIKCWGKGIGDEPGEMGDALLPVEL